VGACRERCWRTDWVIDLDVKAFFDSVPHELVLRAVRRHTELPWVVLYVQRWLQAPLQRPDGTLVARDRGTPQGSAISPLLANLFMHYAFDRWMGKQFPHVRFERYCDDVVVHCATERQARAVRDAIGERLRACGLELNADKTRVVYCKDDKRRGSHDHVRFDFLGYTFRPRFVEDRRGRHFIGFNPAVSNDAQRSIGRAVRGWRLKRRTTHTLGDLARKVNPFVRGWANYYGHFYKSELHPVFQRINDHLVRWARQKYRRLRASPKRAQAWLATVARRTPGLFAHWQFGARPSGWTTGAV
jgi:RNA-directed DNA polymerase